MELLKDPRVVGVVDDHPYPILFASLSGAHLYGFESHDSDVDVRGAHVLPVTDMLRLGDAPDTHELMDVIDGLEVDVVTYDLKKFLALLLKKNGNVLEQLVSPLIVTTSDAHEELRALATDCVCRHHVHHYRGMTKNRLKAFLTDFELKPLLYAFRAATTGIHLLRTGICQPNLAALAHDYDIGFVHELIERKAAGEHVKMAPDEAARWEPEVLALLDRLEAAFESSTLREAPTNADAVDDFLVRVRLAS